MPQSFASIYIHLVFSTKNRTPLINPDWAPRLYDYLGGTVRGSGSVLSAAGGMPDHVHLLISMGREVTVAGLVRTIKAGSSRWIHDTFPEMASFTWQSGYGAFAVCQDRLERVRRYIGNQAERHRTTSFQDEFREFLKQHDIAWDERYVWD